MIPLSDGIPARRFPFVNVTIIVANFAVWLFLEVPGLMSARANGGGVAFFAHIGGFAFGALVTSVLVSAGRMRAAGNVQSNSGPVAL